MVDVWECSVICLPILLTGPLHQHFMSSHSVSKTLHTTPSLPAGAGLSVVCLMAVPPQWLVALFAKSCYFPLVNILHIGPEIPEWTRQQWRALFSVDHRAVYRLGHLSACPLPYTAKDVRAQKRKKLTNEILSSWQISLIRHCSACLYFVISRNIPYSNDRPSDFDE